MRSPESWRKLFRRMVLPIMALSLLLAFVLYAPVVPFSPACTANDPQQIHLLGKEGEARIGLWVGPTPWKVDARFSPFLARRIEKSLDAPTLLIGDQVFSTLGAHLAAPNDFDAASLLPVPLQDRASQVSYLWRHDWRDLLPLVIRFPMARASITEFAVEDAVKELAGLNELGRDYRFDYQRISPTSPFSPDCEIAQVLISAESALLWQRELRDFVVFDPPEEPDPNFLQKMNEQIERSQLGRGG